MTTRRRGRALGWQGLGTAVTQAAQAAVTLTAAALLPPSEFALWAVAAIIFNAQNIIGGLGLAPALIYFPDSRRLRAAVDSAFLVTTAVGVAAAAISFALAPTIAALFAKGFDQADVIAVVRAMSFVLAFGTFATIPQALVEKRLAFRRRAVVDIAVSIAYVAISLSLLALGGGIWSLVIAKVVQSVLLVGGFWIVAPMWPSRIPRWHRDVGARLVRYAVLATTAGIIGFLTGNVDNGAVGTLFGAAALGAYALAFTIANLVPTLLTQTVGKVFFPIYARVQDDSRALREAFGTALHYIAAAMVPTTAGLIVLGPATLTDLFGEKWATATTMLQILAVYGLLRSIGSAAAGLLGGTGRPGLTVVTNLLSLGFSIALIPIFEPFGPAGLAGAFTVGQAASTFSALIMTRRLRPERVMSLVRGVVLATAVGLGAALIIMPGITASANGPAALIVFGVVYVGMLLTLDRRLRADLITTVRSKVDAPAER